MLDKHEVINILESLLNAKTNSAVACSVIHIEPIVNELIARNPNLMYVVNSRILRNRVNNARVRFVTTLDGAFKLVGLRFENSFVLNGMNPEISGHVSCRSQKTHTFEMFGG